ncbi:hypothetical protein EYF80_024689 [Liparis tanakae]|uniref:Uncharacterized protein n=1 Tax=Liparis tanakae TaxID=230148 RepID=A0A4Z2HHR6_9TELE|nr:hypothetical protein EYF80_024689 [Liparis tanakae]
MEGGETPAKDGFSAGYVLKAKAEEIIDTMPGRLFGARYILGVSGRNHFAPHVVEHALEKNEVNRGGRRQLEREKRRRREEDGGGEGVTPMFT